MLIQLFARQYSKLLPVILLSFASSVAFCAENPPLPNSVGTGQILNLPMQFVKNAGQVDRRVDFVSRGPGYTLFLNSTEAVFSLTTSENNSKSKSRRADNSRTEQVDLRMQLVGSNPHAESEQIQQTSGSVSYMIGNRPENWVVNVPGFEKVKYHEVYPGISLVYYGNQKQLEYDFVAAPDANPRQISLSFPGVDQLEVSDDGALLIRLGPAKLRWHKPIAYQIRDGTRTEIPAEFVMKGANQVGFEVASYDRSIPLVIDPALLFATFIGGSGNDYVCGIALDSSGNILIAGNTSSLNYPAVSAYHSTSGGGIDGFITKMNNAGTALLYSTYIGGNGTEVVQALAVDSSGNAYITGNTDSLNFPTRNAAYSANAGFNDVFIAKIGPFGTNLLYGSYLGGSVGDDFGNAIAVDNSGNAYVAGYTYSIGNGNGLFPTVPQNAYQSRDGGGSRDAFVAKFATTNSGSSSLIYSTFLGGSSDEKAYGIAVDPSGNAIVVGEVYSGPVYPTPPSSDFPLLNAFQSSFNMGNLDPLAGNRDAFVTKLNATGSGLIFSTFLGGGDDDLATGVVLDSTGKIYVVGESSSTNFPVTFNAVQSLVSGGQDGFPAPDMFITVFQTNGASLYYSTLLGGSGYESGFGLYHAGIAVDKFGYIYVAGETESIDDFPVTDGADQTLSLGLSDGFVAKINPNVTGPPGLVYSTFLGGDDADRATGIVVDSNGVFYVTGFTSSVTNFATANAYRGTNSGGVDVFIAKFQSPPDLSVSMIPSAEPITVGSNLTYTIQVNNNGRSSFSGVSNVIQFSTNVTLLAVSSTAGNWSTNTTTNGTRLVFNLGVMTNNAAIIQSVTIANPTPVFMTNTATLTANETELNTDNNLAIVPATVRGIADIRLTVTSTPEPVSLTSNVTYTLVVNNKGPYAANLVELTENLPDGVSFVSAVSSMGTITNYGGGILVFDFPLITNGTSATVTIVGTAVTNGVWTNLAAVTGLEVDLVPGNNLASTTTTINPLSDLAIGQSGPSSGYAGSNFVYTLNFTNRGPSTATAVTITDTLPAGATYISALNPLGTVSQLNGVVTCTISSLASNATGVITVTVKPLVGGTVTNTATITSNSDEPTPANNSASIVTTVIPAADLGISQNISPSSGQVLSNFTITVTITNRGPSAASNVSVTNILPGALSVVSIQSPGASSSQAGNVLTFNFGSMTNGASGSISILAQANFDGVFTNVASIGSATTDLNPSNTSSATITITSNPNAPVLKAARAGSQIVLSWSTNAPGFILQARPDLSPSTVWTNVTASPVRVGNVWTVTHDITGPMMFYRLIQGSPPMAAFRVQNKVVVSWPAYGTIVPTLKSTPSLSDPITWTDVGIAPTLINGSYFVTNSIAGSAFYRLFY